MTTPDTSAATSSRSGQLSGAMSSDTPETFLPHSPARPVAGEATPGLFPPHGDNLETAGGSALFSHMIGSHEFAREMWAHVASVYASEGMTDAQRHAEARCMAATCAILNGGE